MRVWAMFTAALIVSARAEPPLDCSAALETIRAKHQLPALAAVAMIAGEVRSAGAVGVRKLGSPEKVTLEDKWQIGSCTKPMTATLAAMLIEQGKLRWDSTIAEVLPEIGETMDPSWRAVTLEMLLTHRSGAPGEAPPNLWRNAMARIGSATEQRMNFVTGLTLRRTEEPPGSKYVYSNQGYAIAGAMLERTAGKPWEDLIRTMLFGPCNLASAGFGEPASPGRVDQPWGHLGVEMRPVGAGPAADNPPAIGPAGAVHCSILDLARFAALHSVGERHGTMFLKRAGFQKLHTPPAGQNYAVGWISVPRSWAGGNALAHNGTNTMFFAAVWIAPARDAVFVAAANAGGAAGQMGTDDAVSTLIGQLLK